MTHEWEELFVSSGYQQFEAAGVDRCKNCKALRIKADSADIPKGIKETQPYFYLRAGWSSPEEPPCHE